MYGDIFTLAPSPVDASVDLDGLRRRPRARDPRRRRRRGRTSRPGTRRGADQRRWRPRPTTPGTAYVAVTRYKFGDFTPMAYRTDRLRATLDEDRRTASRAEHWVRVVREDTEVPGLLYAGTELGALRLLRRRRPLADPAARPARHAGDGPEGDDGDLVAATQGRAFWILDDLSPLRELAVQHDAIARAPVWLFAHRAPRTARVAEAASAGGPHEGRNPPSGAVLQFHLADAPEGEARLDDPGPRGRGGAHLHDGARRRARRARAS